MKLSVRSSLAIVLLAIAIGVPSVSWFVAGSREAARESERLVEDARSEARRAANAAADRLRGELESLRLRESTRPWFHYQNLFHDPRGASEGLSVVPSPLSQGPVDPLIAAHFQVDASGRVTIPTLNEDLAELNAPDVARERGIRDSITPVAQEILRAGEPLIAALEKEVATRPRPIAAAREETRLVSAPPASRNTTRPGVTKQSEQPNQASAPAEEPSKQQVIVQSIEPSAYSQNAMSNEVYTAIKAKQGTRLDKDDTSASQAGSSSSDSAQQEELPVSSETGPESRPAPAPNDPRSEPGAYSQTARANEVYTSIKAKQRATQSTRHGADPRQEQVEIATSDFAWVTLDIAGRPSLVAIRPVITPAGSSTQGFVVASETLAAPLRGSELLRLESSRPGGTTAAISIGAGAWSIVIDENVLTRPAIVQAAEIRDAFHRSFYVGIFAALLAIAAVAMLILRTEQLARQRSQFAASAAHELRTPLAGLKLYGDMLAEGLGDPNRSRAYAQNVASEADRLGRVVTNMLEFTRLERGALAVRPEPGDLAAAVEANVEQLRPALESQGCKVSLEIGTEVPEVSFDRDAFAQILHNLLDNAEKYSRESRERVVDVTVTRNGSGASVTVSDRGRGIPPSVARHLFRPFGRGNGSSAPAGLGLGLALVRALARAHGGDVEFTPRDGGGTEFRLTLPG